MAMTIEAAAKRIVDNFGDVCDKDTMSSMLWAFDRGNEAVQVYRGYISLAMANRFGGETK